MTRHRASARAYQTEHFNVRICPGSPRRSPTGFFRSRSRVDLLKCDTSPAGRGSFMNQFIFEPIRVNSNAPGGACILRTFGDVGLSSSITWRPKTADPDIGKLYCRI